MQKLPPLVELREFDAASRHLSFKKAAAELGVTPTAISHQIRLLERYCGRTLFRRSSGDDDKRVCEPLARPTPAHVAEVASRYPAGRDRDRQCARSAVGRRRRCHSLCHRSGSANRWHCRATPERHLLAPLQSKLAFTGAVEETCRPRKTRLDPFLL